MNQLGDILCLCKDLEVKSRAHKDYPSEKLLAYITENAKINPNIHFKIGELYEQGVKNFFTKDEKQAEKFYLDAAKIGDTRTGAWLKLGDIYKKRNAKPQAIKYYEKFDKSSGDIAVKAWMTLGEIYETDEYKSKGEAFDYYTKVVQMKPHHLKREQRHISGWVKYHTMMLQPRLLIIIIKRLQNWEMPKPI